MVKNQPVMQETLVRSLDQEDPLKKEMATHSSILAWKIPWTEEPGRLQSVGSQKSRHDLVNKQQQCTLYYLPSRPCFISLCPTSVSFIFQTNHLH